MDPETRGTFTIKGYRSHKDPDGLNQYIELLPVNKDSPVLRFDGKDDTVDFQLRFIVEFVEVIK